MSGTTFSKSSPSPFSSLNPGKTGYFGEIYRFTFNGKEAEPIFGEGFSDFGARIYDGRLGRWLSCDPLEKKYPSVSPYVFVANMPCIAIDPDGEKIIIVYRDQNGNKHKLIYQPGMILDPKLAESSSFLKNTVDALNYLRENGGREEIDKIASDKRKIKIKESQYGGPGNRKVILSRTIRWSPKSGLHAIKTDNTYTGESMSPAALLWHELGHVYLRWFGTLFSKDGKRDKIESLKSKEEQIAYHESKEEKYLVTKWEIKIEGEGRRYNHGGVYEIVFDGKSTTRPKLPKSKIGKNYKIW